MFALAAATPAFAQDGESSSNTGTSGEQTGTQPAGGKSAGGASMSPRVFVFGKLAFGGELDAELEVDPEGGSSRSTDLPYGDMEMTNGLGAHFGVPVHRFFTIGGRVSYVSYLTEVLDDLDSDRLTLLNIDAAPKARYPLAGGNAEIYATVPVGVSLNFPSDDLMGGGQGSVDFNTTVSWNISLLGGASYMFSSNLGVFAEGGLYNQNMRLTASESGGKATISGSFSQFGLLAGVTATF